MNGTKWNNMKVYQNKYDERNKVEQYNWIRVNASRKRSSHSATQTHQPKPRGNIRH